TGKLAFMAEHTHRAARAQAQGKATNFLISSFLHRTLSVLSVKSVVKISATSTPVPGGHYQIVTGGNALGLELYHQASAWRAVRQRMGRFISVYRLGEDGDLL
ncbi:MAG: hypothetical protein PUD69_01390, partial [Paraprevotella sp.]|nr:hypothetical protein [Paraprevotella sp.]